DGGLLGVRALVARGNLNSERGPRGAPEHAVSAFRPTDLTHELGRARQVEPVRRQVAAHREVQHRIPDGRNEICALREAELQVLDDIVTIEPMEHGRSHAYVLP